MKITLTLNDERFAPGELAYLKEHQDQLVSLLSDALEDYQSRFEKRAKREQSIGNNFSSGIFQKRADIASLLRLAALQTLSVDENDIAIQANLAGGPSLSSEEIQATLGAKANSGRPVLEEESMPPIDMDRFAFRSTGANAHKRLGDRK